MKKDSLRCLIQYFLKSDPLGSVRHIDDAALREPVLFQHAPHGTVAGMGIRAQILYTQFFRQFFGKPHKDAGTAVSFALRCDAGAVQDDIRTVILPLPVLDHPVAGIDRLPDTAVSLHFPGKRQDIAAFILNIFFQYFWIGISVLPLVDRLRRQVFLGFVDDHHDGRNIRIFRSSYHRLYEKSGNGAAFQSFVNCSTFRTKIVAPPICTSTGKDAYLPMS